MLEKLLVNAGQIHVFAKSTLVVTQYGHSNPLDATEQPVLFKLQASDCQEASTKKGIRSTTDDINIATRLILNFIDYKQ